MTWPMDEDWDTLIILDACRAREFQAIYGGDERRSPASATGEFIREVWLGEQYHDTVYVTGNPHAEMLEDTFHARRICYDHDWDEDVHTVMPAPISDRAHETRIDFPNKRMIVHYMQPHEPYIGPTGDVLRSNHDLRGWDKYHEVPDMAGNMSGERVWDLVRDGVVTHDELRQAYIENLVLVMASVIQLVGVLDEKVVVTADHGEMLGETWGGEPVYGHPKDIDHTLLRTVPWREFPSDERILATPGPPRAPETIVPEGVMTRLEALGYLDSDVY